LTERARLSVRGVEKSFGATRALAGVDLDAAPAEVHAVIGENGAGKSTLMAVLAGAIAPDAGEMRLDGEPHAPRDPQDARRAGVAIVYQEPELCAHLTVAENVLLGAEPTRFGVVDRRELEARAARALALVCDASRAGAPRPDVLVGTLAPAARQLVGIARALGERDCRVLILDEPTSSLSSEDVTHLFGAIENLKRHGLTILYISHFLEEVQRIADRFTVLRDGRNVGSGATAESSLDEIVKLMAGRALEATFCRSKHEPGEAILELHDLAGVHKPASASLVLHRGEVLGIAGLVGAGRTELLRAIFGLDPVRRGTVRVGVVTGPASPARRLAEGVGLLSEDRNGEGLAQALSVAENLTLSKLGGLGPRGFVFPARRARIARQWIERLGIRARDPDNPASSLSGGNQQKLALARLLYQDADVLLLDEPTRGIDVASRSEIYRIIDRLALDGRAVLMVSSYLPELLGTADRIAVMMRGRLGEAHAVAELDEHALLKEASGA
jgi:ribose transport system ATP-binding protein